MERAGVDGFVVTTNIDLGVGGNHPLATARTIRTCSRLPVAVSGGFSAADDTLAANADWDIAIVGRSIVDVVDPAEIVTTADQHHPQHSQQGAPVIVTPLQPENINDVRRLMETGRSSLSALGRPIHRVAPSASAYHTLLRVAQGEIVHPTRGRRQYVRPRRHRPGADPRPAADALGTDLVHRQRKRPHPRAR
jgi:hypothetical protein